MSQNNDNLTISEIPKVSVTKMTFDVLLQNIMNGTWKKGEKIPSENELKNSLKVSRHTIRSAIANLNMLGILETHRGDGNYVKETGIGLYIDFLVPFLMINKSNISQIIEFRESIEISATHYAAVRAEENDLKTIREKLLACDANQNDTLSYPTYDLEFHSAIAAASKNDLLIQSLNVIKRYCFDAISDYFNEELAKEGADYHHEIYNALEKHDPVAATHFMSEHMRNILKRVSDE